MRSIFDEFFGGANVFDQFFGGNSIGSFTGFGRFGSGQFPVDIIRHDDRLEFKASVPGITAEELKITISPNRTLNLTIDRTLNESTTGRYILKERGFTQLHRSFTLPDNADVDRAEVNLDEGVLTITIPTNAAEASMLRVLPINQNRALDKGRTSLIS